MQTILQLASVFALASTIIPAAFFLFGQVELDQLKWLMFLATIVWFIVTPLWMGRSIDTKDEVVIP